MSLTLTFYGATGEVTGSCVKFNYKNGKKSFNGLFDCGAFQGDMEGSFRKNAGIIGTIGVGNVDMILLSHPHTDHGGNIPYLMSYKEKIRVVCTEESGQILPIMWDDGLKIHRAIVDILRAQNNGKKVYDISNGGNKKGKRDFPDREEKKPKGGIAKSKNVFRTLYTEDHVQIAKDSLYSISYNKWINLVKGLRMMFVDTGHTLGSAGILLEYEVKDNIKRLFYTGDIGSTNSVILDEPQKPNVPIDYLITESTYGDRIREDSKKQFKKMIEKIEKTLKNGGKVIVPAFAFQRSQEFLMQIFPYIRKLNDNLGTKVPIYMDSPMGIKINKVFKNHLGSKLEEEMKSMEEISDYDKIGEQYQNLIDDVMGAFSYDALNEINGMSIEDRDLFVKDLYYGSMKDKPAIIISSSGMCDNGPILGHIKGGALSDPKNLFLFIGYNAENTRGRRIQDLQNIHSGMRNIPVRGENIIVQSNIFSIDCFSSHADQNALVRYIRGMDFRDRSESKIFLMHGDEYALLGLKNALLTNNTMAGITDKNIKIPSMGDSFRL